ncbi:hypothetical protein EJF18_20207 [Clavispora lusitaniae]|uniref:Uncharacterized protein n=1 Tax=Clavispora lusitaniae TaxID=36911 RepID=A0ACD0WG98_CLALS|nr:hypothetical protein EJF14_20207 [Clavispora lusitaniae]QFZ31976.1 hypothetical protein EJF16_20207 [Clavispora lusitaniae]QFZ37645.1 hypothetical protein EJF15_20207 [Clavispora lusitaniae]QFZ43329.1 hypothetical protein EJF18_20207 [Clavispora lusitaniae]QFZ49005.1 hypothetical protein EJF17_20207 [Clavispora lusitaniae]
MSFKTKCPITWQSKLRRFARVQRVVYGLNTRVDAITDPKREIDDDTVRAKETEKDKDYHEEGEETSSGANYSKQSGDKGKFLAESMESDYSNVGYSAFEKDSERETMIASAHDDEKAALQNPKDADSTIDSFEKEVSLYGSEKKQTSIDHAKIRGRKETSQNSLSSSTASRQTLLSEGLSSSASDEIAEGREKRRSRVWKRLKRKVSVKRKSSHNSD